MTGINKSVLGIGLLGMVVGAVGVVEALVFRTHATNLGSYTPWGLGVATYLYFLGLSAGALLVSLLIHAFGAERYKKLSLMATWIALAAELAAGLTIALDLGRWERMTGFILHPSFSSPMTWMFVLFTSVFILYLLKLVYIRRGDADGERGVTLISIPVALAFYGVNGLFFGILSSHPIWFGAHTPLFFIVAALLSGGALVAWAALVFGYGDDLVIGIGRVLLLLLVVFVVYQGLSIYTGLRGAKVEQVEAIHFMLFGPHAWSFWVLNLGLAGVLPLLMLALGGKDPRMVGFACLSLVIGFAGLRWDLVVPAQSTAVLPGLDQAWTHPRLTFAYAPNLGEWLVTLFAASLVLTVVCLFPRAKAYFNPAKEG